MRPRLLAIAAVAAVLTVSCGDVHHVAVTVPTTTPTTAKASPVTTSTLPPTTTARPTTSTTRAPAVDYHLWSDWPTWRCIGRNEQGAAAGGPYDSNGDGIAWHGSPAGGLPGSGYPGGLGIMRAAWDDARGAAGVAVANGAYASPGQQIEVGRVIVARFGWRAWAAETLRKCGLR